MTDDLGFAQVGPPRSGRPSATERKLHIGAKARQYRCSRPFAGGLRRYDRWHGQGDKPVKSGSEKLADAIQAIRAFAARPEVGKRIRPELDEIAVRIEQDRARLAEIEDLYAIDFGSDVDSGIAEAMKLWETAIDGKIAGDALLPIRRVSPMLSALYLKGIDIKSAYKFSSDQSALARELGTRFDQAADILRAFRSEKRNAKDPGEWSMLVPMRKSVKNILLDLENRGAIEGRQILVRNKQKHWTPFDLKWLRDEPETQLLVIYGKKDPGGVQFLRGEWLNCYVADIIRDQLTRHEIAFELYTDVSYSAPADLIRAASEFDVIGRFRDTIICVECKSGRLDADRGDFANLVQRTETMRKVLSSMGDGENRFLFFVVYDPVNNAEEEVRR
jgi:hypothetical protein